MVEESITQSTEKYKAIEFQAFTSQIFCYSSCQRADNVTSSREKREETCRFVNNFTLDRVSPEMYYRHLLLSRNRVCFMVLWKVTMKMKTKEYLLKKR